MKSLFLSSIAILFGYAPTPTLTKGAPTLYKPTYSTNNKAFTKGKRQRSQRIRANRRKNKGRK